MVAPNPNFPDGSGYGGRPESDFRHRDAGHQPPNPTDLEEFPPDGSTCARIRGMLRDFVDGDVTVAEQAAVETHAHECRTCALALSRAEGERMQITAALDEVDTSAIGPSAGFTESVMQQVRETAVSQPSVGFTTRVMARVRETALAESVLGSDGSSRRRHRIPIYVLLAATMMLATWIGLQVFEPAAPAAVEVLAAERAAMVRDGVSMPLVATDHWQAEELRVGDEFTTRAGGVLDLRWRPTGKPVGLRAGEFTRFRVSVADGVVPSDDPSVVDLRDGALSVRTDTGVTVALGDGSAVNVERGHYRVTVQGVRHQDARAGLLVKVHVRDGAARIQRGGRDTVVAAGLQALYTTFTPVTIDRAPDDDLFLASRRRAQNRAAEAPEVSAGEARFFGQVLDPRTSTPVANVSVAISTFRGDETVTTNEDGMFELTDRKEIRGQFVLIRAVPPPSLPELAPLRFASVFLGPRDGLDRGRVRRFFLERAGDLGGRVQDASRRPPKGLWLQLCSVDEFLGTVAPIGGRTYGDETGQFTIRGLPTESRSHQTMLLVAGAEGRRPRVVWARSAVKVEDAALDIVLPPVKVQQVGGFEPGQELHLLLAIAGVPAGSGVSPTTVRADAAGLVTLDFSAPVFLLSDSQPPRLLKAAAGSEGAAKEAVSTIELVDVPLSHPLRGMRLGSPLTRNVHWFRADRLPRVAHMAATGGFVSVIEESSGQACAGASVFLRGVDGSVRFLGIYDGRVSLQCAGTTAGVLLARTPQGWVGQLDLEGALGRARKSMAVQKPGRVAWEGASNGVVVLQRAMDGGRTLPIVRQGDEREWPLHSGSYQFGSQTLTVEPDATVTLK